MTLIVGTMTAEACPVPASTVYMPVSGAGDGRQAGMVEDAGYPWDCIPRGY
jgi:hypothetical protein